MRKRNRSKKQPQSWFGLLLVLLVGLFLFYQEEQRKKELPFKENDQIVSYSLDQIPEYQGNSSIVLQENRPNFTDADYQLDSFESYHDLDDLGRAGTAIAKVGLETMPTEKRGSIGSVRPSGWQTIKYETIPGKYLYNRCHLIGYQLTGENANVNNLITCTRSMNTEGMLEFENQVATYVKETQHHVLYRVTPIFEGTNLVASGVTIEASSVEDRCGDICFYVYVYNVQPGIKIDYQTGESSLIP